MRTTNKDLWEWLTPISVRQEDIKLASTDKNGKCPVWHAFMRVFPGFTVKVLKTTIQVFPGKGNKGMYGKLPYQAVEFGKDFDQRTKFREFPLMPFLFSVDFRI